MLGEPVQQHNSRTGARRDGMQGDFAARDVSVNQLDAVEFHDVVITWQRHVTATEWGCQTVKKL